MVENLRKYFKGDPVIWGVIVALTIVSLLAVYSSTGTLAYKFRDGNTAFYVLRHLTFQFIGLIIIFVTHRIPYKYYSRLSQVLMLISIPMLLFTLLFGRHLNDASRWMALPGGISFQTSDFAKLALMMYLARVLSLKQDEIKDFKKAFLPLIAPVAIICLLILPANFSTAAILMATCIIVMFVGRVNMKHIMALAGIGVVLVGLFIGISLAFNKEGRIGTWKSRIENFVSGKGDNFQVEQSKIAVATGGIIGKGPGNSVQRNYLPHPYSDFIYAIIIEEYGVVGGIVILAFYLWLLFRAGMIVRKSDRTFPAFLAIGLTVLLVFQAMVNMAVAVNLFPVTGQPLPLVSMGGTSMLFTFFALGIILSISNGVTQLEVIPTADAQNNNGEPSSENVNYGEEN
jgi:cell division protein FtsW